LIKNKAVGFPLNIKTVYRIVIMHRTL